MFIYECILVMFTLPHHLLLILICHQYFIENVCFQFILVMDFDYIIDVNFGSFENNYLSRFLKLSYESVIIECTA